MKYSFDSQLYMPNNSLKFSADKTFVVTYKHFVVTTVKPRLVKGLMAISAGVLTTY